MQPFRLAYIHWTQRTIAIFTLSTIALGATMILLDDLRTGALLIALACGALSYAFWRGWRYASQTSILLLTILIGISLPAPFVHDVAGLPVLIPPLLALVVANARWIGLATLGTLAILIARAGLGGVYTAPTTLVIIGMIVVGMILTRLSFDYMLQQMTRQADSLRFQATLLDVVEQAIIATTPQGVITYWNRFAERLYGWSSQEAIGRSIRELLLTNEQHSYGDRILAEQQQGTSFGGEYTLRRRDGGLVQVYASASAIRDPSGAVVGLVGISADVSDRKRLEAQLLQAQKLESVGRLAGGVAHDFNNLLTVISGYTELALHNPDLDTNTRHDLEDIKHSAMRAGTLVRQLLLFARRERRQPRPVRINDLVIGLDKLLRRLISADIELVTLLEQECGFISADPGQIEQVLINLAINAHDAMTQGGKLTIQTGSMILNDHSAAAIGPLAAGAYTIISVADTGTGIAPEYMNYIFEPFFTTKEVGTSTGLGLATCYGIVREHGGQIICESTPGKGTAFSIYMPQIAAPAPLATVSVAPQAKLVAGNETILFVEDEPRVRQMIARALRRQGYKVLEAGNGEEALGLLAEQQVDLDLLLTDVVMPRMGGVPLAETLLARMPNLKVLFVSGYTDDLRLAHLPAHQCLLNKPFLPADILIHVRSLLDAPA